MVTVLSPEQASKKAQAEATSRQRAITLAKREGGDRIIFSGGRRYISRGGRIVAEEPGKEASAFLEAERRKKEAERKALEEQKRKEEIIRQEKLAAERKRIEQKLIIEKRLRAKETIKLRIEQARIRILQRKKIETEQKARKEKAAERQKRLLTTPDKELNFSERVEKSLLKKGIFERTATFLLRSQEKLGERLQKTKFGQTKAGKFILKDIKVPKNQAVAFVSDMGKFVFFSPAMLTRGEILTKLPTDTIVKFIGKQKTKGNKIITNVVFESAGKRIGFAKGITIFARNKAVTKTVGRIGRKGIKFPSGKMGLFEREVFAGIEKSAIKPSIFQLKKEVKNIGTITKNIKGIAQASYGRIIQVKGDKIIKTGIRFPRGKIIKKKVPGISTDDFISVAGAFTKKDLNLIIGKTLTKAGDRIRFIGLIKGVKKLKTPGVKGGLLLTKDQQNLYSKAMKNVLGVVSSAAKAKKIKGLSPIAKSIISTIAIKTTPVTPKVIPKAIPKPEVIPLSAKAKQKEKQITQEISKTGAKIKQLQKQKPKVKQKEKVKISTRIRQLQKQRQKLRLTLRLIPKIRPIVKPRISIKIKPKLRITKIPPPIKKFKKIKKRKPKKKKPQAYNVYARPLKKYKKQKRPKLIRINKVPLSKKRAKDLRNYITDTSLARTSRIKPTKGKIGKSRLKVPVGYAAKTKYKFRTYRIVKGKRKPLVKGKVIEKRKRLLDTRQEKNKITLRRRIAQIRKPIKKAKRIKRK